MESVIAANTIQGWWRLMGKFRCCRCGSLYKGEIMCDPCYWFRHDEYIPDSFWEDLKKDEEERKRKSQEKKRALGLIP